MRELPIHLDPLDRRLLVALRRTPTAPYATLGEALQLSPRTIARRLARLRAHGLVRIVGRTLPGFGGRLAWLTRTRAAPDLVEAMAHQAARQDNSRWVRLSRDGSELMCGLVTDDPTHDPLLRGFPHDPRAHDVRIHELLHVWGGHGNAVTTATRDMDALDNRLLGEFARDGRLDTRQLAARLDVDPSTVSRRRRRLVREGVLYFEADVHPAALGGTGDAMLWLRVAPGHVTALGRLLWERPEVRFVAATGGRASLVANVHVSEPAELVEFVDTHLADAGVVDVEIAPMGRVLKRNAV